MKKIVIVLLSLGVALFFGWTYVKGEISVDITADDLPENVYTTDPAFLFVRAQYNLFQIANPFSSEDNFSLTEDYLNFMLFHSIRKNINADYNPLDANCDEPECDVIQSTTFGDIEYAYVTLNEADRIVLHVNFNRQDVLSVETAVIAVFDVDISVMDMTLTLTLEDVYINDIEIKESQLDWLISRFDQDSIESSIAIGQLDLDQKTYEVDLLASFDQED